MLPEKEATVGEEEERLVPLYLDDEAMRDADSRQQEAEAAAAAELVRCPLRSIYLYMCVIGV